MTRLLHKVWVILIISSLLITQAGEALARGNFEPDSPSAIPPGLLEPANGAYIKDTTPTFTWQDQGAASYQFQLSATISFSLPVVLDETVGVSTFTPAADLPETTYYWRVQSYDGAAWSGWGEVRSLTVDITPPAAPALASPSDNVFTNVNSVAFSWNSVTDANLYNLQVSTAADFSSFIYDLTQSGTNYNPGAPLGDNTYYWRVKAIDLAGNNSDWSTVRTFTIDTAPPGVPVLSSPADNFVTNDNTPTFTWAPTPGASQYRIQIANNPNFNNPKVDTLVNVPSYTPAIVLNDGNYYWRVLARDAAGNQSSYSSSRRLTIDTLAPDVPTLASPVNNTFTSGNTPTFAWNAANGASQYRLQVDSSIDFTNPSINQLQPGLSFTPSSPMPDGTYYWRVQAQDTAGNTSAWSTPTWTLTVDTLPPSAPTLLSPADGSFTSDNTPLFSWNAVTGAKEYRLQVSSALDFLSTAVDQVQPGTSFAPVNLLADGLYYWRVQAIDFANNISPWSTPAWSFTVDTLPPPVPVLLTPAEGAILNDPTPDFSWEAAVGATSYRLQIGLNGNFNPPTQNLVINGNAFTLVVPLVDGNYTWRVRASDAADNTSSYSTPRNLTIDTVLPATPALIAPPDGALLNDGKPAFAWNASTGAAQYQIQVDDNSNFLSPVIDQLVGATGYSPLNNLVDGTYYWHVRAIDLASNASNWSPTWTLVIYVTVPGAPVLITPLDAAFTNDNTPLFTWNAVTGAVEYQVQVDDDPAFTSLNYEQLTAATSTTPVASFSDGVYHWRVRARDAGSNWGDWSLVRSFTVDTIAPAAPVLVSPAEGTITANNMPAFSWSSVTGAVSYRLVVDVSGGFVSPYVIDQTISGLSYAAPSPIADGNYIWHVRAIDAAGNAGNYSMTRNFTIDTTASSVPTLIQPTNGGIVTDSTPTLLWSSSAGAVLYHVMLDNDSNFSSTIVAATTASTSYTVVNVLADGTYFWHVQAQDAAGNLSAWSAAWSFVVDSVPPPAPVLVSPANGLVTNDNIPTFTWSISGDAVQANIVVDNNNDFSSPLLNITSGGSTYTWGNSFADGSYFWRARALDAAGNPSGWTAAFSFGIDTDPPGAVTLLSPAPGGKTVDSTPTFDWSDAVGATKYRIQVGRGDSFTDMVVDQILDQSVFTVTIPLAQGLYSWRVRGIDDANNLGDFTGRRELTVFSFVNPVYREGFESGVLGQGWTWVLQNKGRYQITQAEGYQSTKSLFLDASVGGDPADSMAAVILTANMTGMSVAKLSFSWRGFASINTSADGVYISDDYGNDWCRIYNFDDPHKYYESVTLDLIDEAKKCIRIDKGGIGRAVQLNDHFQIKFQFWGSQSIPNDGYGIDDITLYALKPAAYLPLINR